MKTTRNLLTTWFLAGLTVASLGQSLDVGSNGSLGALNVENSDITVDLPPDGRLHYTTVTVASGRTLRFLRNGLNTPVYLLAQGDVIVNGAIDVSGSAAPGNPPIGGVGGPGGFDGGKPGTGAGFPPGDGYGPGGGGGGATSTGPTSAGAAGYGEPGGAGGSGQRGTAYGSPLLIPLIGGSGGGGDTGSPGSGGGGGGGAILIGSNTRVRILGEVRAQGGSWRGSSDNAGSGGAIRLLAPRIEGSGRVRVAGGFPGGGSGRIRVDCYDRTGMQLSFEPSPATASVGAMMFVEPPVLPRLDIVEAAGQAIQVGTDGLVRIQLPFGSETNQTITVRAKDFKMDVPVRLTLTPDNGPRIMIDTNINNLVSNPATLVVPVGLPANTLLTIHAWTR